MRATLLALLLALVVSLGAGCEAPPELQEVREVIAKKEQLADEAAAQGDSVLAGEAQLSADELRALVAEILAGEGTRTTDSTFEALKEGSILAALAALGLGTEVLRRTLREARDEGKRDLADLERRRDESRALQGIAAATERSATQQQSAVAKAAGVAPGGGVA